MHLKVRSERVGGQGAAAVRCQPVLGEAPGEESLCTETGADRTPGMTQSGEKLLRLAAEFC